MSNFTPAWFKKGFFNESLFCDDFLSTHQLLYSNGALKKPFLNHAGVKLLIGTPSFLGVTEKRCDHFEHIVFLRNWEINILPFSLHGFPAPFRRRFPALPLGGHRRVSHADGHAVFKVQQAKRQQKSRHKTDQPCLRFFFFWKVMLVGYVTAESQDVQPRRARTNM